MCIREGFKNPSHGICPLGGNFDKFSAKNSTFCPKNTVFRPIFNQKKFNGKGGYPPSPHSGRIFPKN